MALYPVVFSEFTTVVKPQMPALISTVVMMAAFFEKFKLWGMYKHKWEKDQQKGVVDNDRKRKVKGIIAGGFQGKDLAALFEFQSAVGG
jgi:hypothetical protein